MSETGGNNDRGLCTGNINRRVTRSSTHSTSLQSSQEDVSTKAGPAAECGVKVDDSGSAAADSQQQDGGVAIECAVCLQTCIHPVRLPCTHIFCFLCIKGVAFQSRRCAMCRQEIPADVLLHPQLVDRTQLEKETTLEDGYQWFYEGRNGKNCVLLFASFIFLALQTSSVHGARRKRTC